MRKYWRIGGTTVAQAHCRDEPKQGCGTADTGRMDRPARWRSRRVQASFEAWPNHCGSPSDPVDWCSAGSRESRRVARVRNETVTWHDMLRWWTVALAPTA